MYHLFPQVQAYVPYERPALTKAYLFPLDKKPARLPVSIILLFIGVYMYISICLSLCKYASASLLSSYISNGVATVMDEVSGPYCIMPSKVPVLKFCYFSNFFYIFILNLCYFRVSIPVLVLVVKGRHLNGTRRKG